MTERLDTEFSGHQLPRREPLASEEYVPVAAASALDAVLEGEQRLAEGQLEVRRRRASNDGLPVTINV